MQRMISLQLYFSYSEKDVAMLDEIEAGLSMLKREGYITTWDDRLVRPGTDWNREIWEHLDHADIILLLISQGYLNSDFQYGVEMQRALEKHEQREARVIPILLSPCDWQHAPFAHLQLLP